MALPNTDLKLSAIQAEFGGANPINFSTEYYRGGPYVPANTATSPVDGTPITAAPNTAIRMGMFRGTSKVTIVDMSIIISANTQCYNLWDAVGHPSTPVNLNVIIQAEVFVYGRSSLGGSLFNNAAFTVGYGWAAGSIITVNNYGTIGGGGGNSGKTGSNGFYGENGGIGFYTNFNVTVNNVGVIAGGGGQGGGGNGGAYAPSYPGAGGVGAGYHTGALTASLVGQAATGPGAGAGGSGGLTISGVPGNGVNGTGAPSNGGGGGGGALGGNGGNGGYGWLGTSRLDGATGALGGKAIQGKSYVNGGAGVTTGTVYGSQV